MKVETGKADICPVWWRESMWCWYVQIDAEKVETGKTGIWWIAMSYWLYIRLWCPVSIFFAFLETFNFVVRQLHFHTARLQLARTGSEHVWPHFLIIKLGPVWNSRRWKEFHRNGIHMVWCRQAPFGTNESSLPLRRSSGKSNFPSQNLGRQECTMENTQLGDVF
jgi:hypothetical protein